MSSSTSEPHVGKVFCIGLSRTGTASFVTAMRMLGYRAKHFPYVSFRYGRLLAAIGFDELRLDPRDVADHDVLADVTVIPFYRELDEQFSGSKFVLTVRDKASWLDSCERWPRFAPGWKAGAEIRALRRVVYGTEHFDREAFSQAYDRHHADVAGYFEQRPNALLRFDLCAGEGWERLCGFLGRPVPAQPFPHENVGVAS